MKTDEEIIEQLTLEIARHSILMELDSSQGKKDAKLCLKMSMLGEIIDALRGEPEPPRHRRRKVCRGDHFAM